MTVGDPRPARRRRRPRRTDRRIVNARHARTTRRRSTEMRWADATYPGRGAVPRRARRRRRSGRRRSGGSTCTRRSSTPTCGHRSTSLPDARRHGHRGAAAGRRLEATRATPASAASSMPACGRPARRHRVPRPSRLRRARAGQDASASTWPASPRRAVDRPPASADHDARRAARPRRGRPRRRPRDASTTSRAATSRWRPATSPSSGPATSTDRASRPRRSSIALDDASGDVVGLRQPHMRPRVASGRLARHDRGPPGVARTRARDGPQAGDHRAGRSRTA